MILTNVKKTIVETGKGRRGVKRLWLVLVAVAAIVGFLAWKIGLGSRSIDGEFAAIDAELAIPDEENAAVYYKRFFTDPNNATILDDLSKHDPSARHEPWLDDEYPELAVKLKKYKEFIKSFLDISEMPKARFPVNLEPGTDRWDMLIYMRKVTFILSCAAANDLAGGRTDAALRKYQCQMQLARQLQQQPVEMYDQVGIGIEGSALANIRRAVMRQETTPEQLRSLEKILEVPIDRNERYDEIKTRVDRLSEKKEWSRLSMTGKLKRWLNGWKIRREIEQVLRLGRLRFESTRKATTILIALRRYKDKTGSWPDTLEEIEPKLPSQTLIDPQNEGPFVYKRNGDSFIFYSKGPNKIDENGSSKKPADDRPIWPLKIKTIPAGEQ